MNNTEVTSLFDGSIMIIKPKGSITVPLFCDCCEFPMKTKDDMSSYKLIGVCSHCEMYWGYNKDIDFKNNIYPNKSTKEWESYIEDRVVSSCKEIVLR